MRNIILILTIYTVNLCSLDAKANYVKCNGGFNLKFSTPVNNQIAGPLEDSIEFIKNKLMKFNYEGYLNKPVSVLLNGIGLPYREIMYYGTKPHHLYLGYVVYETGIYLDIYIDRFLHMKEYLMPDENISMWKEEDFLKEKVTKIRVRTGDRKVHKEFPKKPILPVF